jgi:hypothetical protein
MDYPNFFMLVDGRIRIRKIITEPDPGGPKTYYGSYGSGMDP